MVLISNKDTDLFTNAEYKMAMVLNCNDFPTVMQMVCKIFTLRNL
jgi:hypothetical protein